MNFNISKAEMLEGMNTMNSFGTRLTGSKGHTDFINWLKDEIGKMGIPIFSDPFYFRRWEEKNSLIEIIDGDEKINIPVSSAYPYSGETTAKGISEELIYIEDVSNIKNISGKIAVFDVANVNFIPSEIAFNKRTSFPEDVVLEKEYEGPVITSFVQCFGGDPFGTMLAGYSLLGTFVVCIVSRTLAGFLVGLIYKLLSKKAANSYVLFPVIGLLAAVFNTLFFMTSLMAIFGNTAELSQMRGGMNLLAFMCAFVGINAVFEIIASTVVTGAVAAALKKAKLIGTVTPKAEPVEA